MRWRYDVRIEAATEWSRSPRYGLEFGGGLWLYLPHRMLRVWANWGTAPGSHMGWWKTSLPGDGLTGWNYRIGRWPNRTLTMLAHTRVLTEGTVR